MRVVLSTYGGRGDVEPLLGVALALQSVGAEVRVCAPEDRTERLAEFGVAFAPVGVPVRPLLHGAERPSAADVPRLGAAILAAQFDTVAAAAIGCDAILATGLLPAAAGARCAAQTLGVPFLYAAYCPFYLPSPHHAPPPLPGRAFPTEVTDNAARWALLTEHADELFADALNACRDSHGLEPVDDVYGFAFTDHPWLAADPTLGPWRETADLAVVQTGAWILNDERPPSFELAAFLDAGTPPVYVGFRSMHPPIDGARVAIEAIRQRGRRVLVAQGRADLLPIDDGDDCFGIGEVNHQAVSQGGRRRAPRRRGDDNRRGESRRAPGRRDPDGGQALLGRPGGGARHRCLPRRPDADARLTVGRARDGASARDPRADSRCGGHDPHRRRDAGRAAVARGDPMIAPTREELLDDASFSGWSRARRAPRRPGAARRR